jgi:DNA-binding LacI/PurR family transcriptional regulator
MLARRVDGIFIFPVYRMAPTAPIYVELEKRRTRVIILGQRAPFCAAFPNVETDDIAGSLSVTRHLIELGHKRIAFLCGPTISPWAQERLEGYRRGLREANIEFDDRLVFNAGGSIEEGESAALQMLNESVQMTAIQAATDLVAIGAANVFLKQGVQIPQEVSVAGYGNVLTAEYFRVPLTTVRQPKLRLGIAAIDMMAKLLRNETIESRRLPAELSVRGSTAAAKNGAPIS